MAMRIMSPLSLQGPALAVTDSRNQQEAAADQATMLSLVAIGRQSPPSPKDTVRRPGTKFFASTSAT